MLGTLALGVALHARSQYREDWRTPIRLLAHERAAGDPVLFDSVVGLVPAGYYDPALRTSRDRLYVSALGELYTVGNAGALTSTTTLPAPAVARGATASLGTVSPR